MIFFNLYKSNNNKNFLTKSQIKVNNYYQKRKDKTMSKLIRKTKQREIILNELCKVTTHPTADELYLMVRDKLPRVSLGTIYRNLEIMAEEGIIRKIETRGKLKRFDGNTDKHLHIRCEKCDKIEDIFLDNYSELETFLQKAMNKKKNFKFLDFELEIVGLCSDCQDGKNSSGWLTH